MNRFSGMAVAGVLAMAMLVPAGPADAQLIISEVIDATLTGGLPKFVEVTNCGNDPIDLSAYSIGNFNNGGTTLGGGQSTLLAGILAPGASYVFAYENAPSDVVCGVDADCGTNQVCDAGTCLSIFEDVFGFSPDQYTGPFVNGDDVIALFLGLATGDGSDATLIDVYGVIGVDGTGEVWEYTDGYSYRLPNSLATPVFDPAQWFFGGVNSLEDSGGDDAIERQLILDNTTPAVHNCGGPPPIPTVSEWGMIIMTLLLLVAATFAFGRRPETTTEC